MNGLLKRDCAIGAGFMALHYRADPGKDADWAARERVKVPLREWLREMEMREDVYDGEPVFADYRDLRNSVPEIQICRGATYIGGWDCGQTLTPAFVLLEITPQPWQVRAILEVVSPGAEPMNKFAPRVLERLQKRLPGRWDEVEHWGDTTVIQQSGANGESAQSEAARHGVRIRPASNEWQGRFGAVTWLLLDSIDDKFPRFVVDRYHCPTLLEGFQGAYKLDVSPSGDAAGPGRVLKAMPLKNDYSHVHDALQYAAARVRLLFKQGRLGP